MKRIGLFDTARYWQKGAIFGFLLVFLIMGANFIAIIGNEARLESKGLPHICAGGTLCSFVEASGSYGKAFFLLILVLGAVAGVMGAFIGYLIDKTQLKF